MDASSSSINRGMSILLVVLSVASQAAAWSNGGYSSDPADPDYGTHDWIAEHALAWLPMSEKKYIMDNKAAYLYGTELPDNDIAPDGIGDQNLHHIYFHSGGTMQDDAAAVRASEEFDNAKGMLMNSTYQLAARTAGIMTAYLADVAVFGHVMGSGTDWGAEGNHSNYEDYVTGQMTGYVSSTFDRHLVFDGRLDIVPAYSAALRIARNTTFGDGSATLDCVWMDDNYDWSDTVFKDSSGASLNRAVNIIADVLHTLAVDAGYLAVDTERPTVIISSPTSGAAWVTAGASVTLGGTATDEFGVTSVSWSNSANNASGTATGLESWTATVNLLVGLNQFTVTALDAAGNTGTDVLNVTRDTTPPEITISFPRNNSTIGPSNMGIAGSASDNVEVESVWASADGVNWIRCSGTTWWSSPLSLNEGRTWIYAKAVDTAGNSKIALVSVTVEIPSGHDDSIDWVPVVLFVLAMFVVVLYLLRTELRYRRRGG